jgi:type VI protein secretion system component Hcp
MNAIKRAVVALLVGGAGLAAGSPSFANSIYLKLPNVTGPVTNRVFLGDILLHAYSQGFTDPAAAATGGSGGAGGGKVTCGAISIVKSIDSTSPDFLRYVTMGTNISSATIYFVGSAVSSTQTVPYTITLTNVRVTSIVQGDTTSNTSGLGITENISMVAEKFQFSYRPLNPDGSLGAAETYGWSCATNSAF